MNSKNISFFILSCALLSGFTKISALTQEQPFLKTFVTAPILRSLDAAPQTVQFFNERSKCVNKQSVQEQRECLEALQKVMQEAQSDNIRNLLAGGVQIAAINALATVAGNSSKNLANPSILAELALALSAAGTAYTTAQVNADLQKLNANATK